METIAQASEMADEMGLPDDSFHRQGNLSFDAHVVRDKLAFSHGSMNLRGHAADKFDLDVILDHFKKRADEDAKGEQLLCNILFTTNESSPNCFFF